MGSEEMREIRGSGYRCQTLRNHGLASNSNIQTDVLLLSAGDVVTVRSWCDP